MTRCVCVSESSESYSESCKCDFVISQGLVEEAQANGIF